MILYLFFGHGIISSFSILQFRTNDETTSTCQLAIKFAMRKSKLGTYNDDTPVVIHDDTTSEFLDNRSLRTTLLSRVFMRRSEFAENGRVTARAPERPPKTAERARDRSSRRWRGHVIGSLSTSRRAHWSVWTAERYRRPIVITSNLFCGRLDMYMSFDTFVLLFFSLHFLSRCFVFLFPGLISFWKHCCNKFYS